MSTINGYSCIRDRVKWLAQWPTIEQIEVGSLPKSSKMPEKYSPTIWQYSSNGKYPDLKGRIDLDYTPITKHDWIKIANPNFIHQVITDDMQWAIDAGIFKGYSDGTLRPDEPLTRGQAATIVRRTVEYMTKYFIK